MKQLSDYIQVIEGVLDPKDCAQFVRTLNEANIWAPTTVDRGVLDTSTRNCEAVNISSRVLSTTSTNPGLSLMDRTLFEAAGTALQAYTEATGAKLSIERDTGYDALRYHEGGFYKEHIDHLAGSHRYVACSFALNDDYEGGEWGFFGGELKLKAPVGSAILFPSNFCFPHQIFPVTKGTRYSVVTWFI